MTTLDPTPALAADPASPRPAASPLRGVNLGNWLILEKWMKPSLFAGVKAGDEYTLCHALGERAESVIREHRETYITEDDFDWLAQRGIDSIRLPIGYWVLEPDGPFVGSIDVLDRAMQWASARDLKVLLDLHGLPGFQGPEHHSGRGGHFRWHLEPDCQQRSIDLVEALAQRYANEPSLVAIGPANEPDPTIPRQLLVDYFAQCRERLRRHAAPEDVALVVAAYPESEMPTYHGCLGHHPDVWTDVHFYQCFVEWSDDALFDYLAANRDRRQHMQPYLDSGPIVVGEWSLGLPSNFNRELEQRDDVVMDAALRTYAGIQLGAFEEYTGWYFWSYKTEDRPQWSFRDAVNRGWLPDRFG